ncbi:type VI secretion system tube protein TssD, partial [Bacteroides uniformis]
MIYETILKIRGMEVPILYYNYRCHIRHYDDPNLRKIIQLHIQVCEEIGNRECLPVEGDLITLAFECKGEEQFFYDWLNEGAVHNGEIHFIYNEVEIADIFRFWDCFCVKIEEYMSAGNSPMMMVLYLSPGIIKRNNLEVREKVWKVSEISDFLLSQLSNEIKETEKRILSVSWSYGKDFIPLKQCSRHYTDINI